MENKDIKSPVIIVNNLTVIGSRKNYSIPFAPGLNIIHGDSDTGKSSILNLIDYCFGAGEIDLYAELESSGKYCLLEVSLNGKVYTIKRDIFESNSLIEVYHSSIADIDKVFPYEYGPNYSRKGESGYISDFFLDALSIPKVETKQSPSKADSKMNRLSFRDVLKFNYLNQDDVGSKDLLDRKNFTVAVKNQETFKFLHNLLDLNITQLQALIAEKTKTKNDLEHKYSTISSFFRETQLKGEELLLNERNELKAKLNIVEEEITRLNKEMTTNTEVSDDLRLAIKDYEGQISDKTSFIESAHLQIRQNILLKNDYTLDIQKIKASIYLSEKLPVEHRVIDCPVCQNGLHLEKLKGKFVDTDASILEQELKSLNRRSKDISAIIDELRNDVLIAESDVQILKDRLSTAKNLLDNRTKEIISPFLAQRDGFLSGRAQYLETLSNIEYTLKIRNQLSEIAKSSTKITLELERLNQALVELKANTPTVEYVTGSIADYLVDYLSSVRMNNVFGVSIDKRTFLPIVRDKEYWQLTSGGVRTLVSVGYFISLLQNSLNSGTYHPNFLMIDTIAKYLGKTKSKYMGDTDSAEDIKEGIKADDPTKYINMYSYLINLCANRSDLQIIIVDNDIPQELAASLKTNVIKEFNVDGHNDLPRGFIDDIY